MSTDETDRQATAQDEEGQLGHQAWEHVRHLCQGIGPRPAGSPQERAARNSITALLHSWGYEVEEQPILFAPLPAFFFPFPLTGALLIATGCFMQTLPFLAVLLPFWMYLLPAYTRHAVRCRPLSQKSANLRARRQTGVAGPARLILSAHIDTARASPITSPFLLRIKYRTMFAAQRVAIALAVFSALLLLGLTLPAWLLIFLCAASTLTGCWLIATQIADQVFHGGTYSPGAHDNASGVGVLLALAEYYANKPPEYLTQIEFLFTGAEETGLHGADAYAAVQSPDGVHPSVLCLDMVGAGNELYIITGEGTYGKIRTSQVLNNLLRQVDPKTKDLWYTMRSGDFAAFLRRGYPAAALQTGGSMAAEYAYHTRQDNLEIIQVPTLERVCKTMIAFGDLFFLEANPTNAPVENPDRPVK